MSIPNIKFHGVVKQGRIKFDSPEKYLVYLAGLEGKRIELTLHKERNSRSNQQNKFYWGIVIEILGEHFGYTPEEMHEELKRKFNPVHSKIDPEASFGGSTTKLSTVEFIDYIDRITRWAASEYQIYIPDPNEVEYE
jgi:hypothetical protein